MKTNYTLYRRGEMFYMQDSATGKQTSLRTKNETEAKSLLSARNDAQRQPVLNLHLPAPIQIETLPLDRRITLRIASEKSE